MKLSFLSGRYQGRVVELRPTGTTVGRARDNDLVLTDDGISRHHCRIYAVDDRWLVQDCDSMNGVCVDGERITGSRELKPGDRVTIHRVALLCMDEATVPPDNDGDPKPAGDTAMPVPPTPQEASGAGPRKPRRRPGGTRFPWVRILLLLLAMALVAWLLLKALVNTGAEETPTLEPEPQPRAVLPDVDNGAGTGPATVAAAAADVRQDEAEGRDAGLPLPPPAQERAANPVVIGAADAGTPFLVSSEPAGATILLDEEAVGVTPTVLRQIPAGAHLLVLRKLGYEDLERTIHASDAFPATPYELQQRPGTVRVTSAPTGASVWHGTQLLGTTPLLATGLGEGTHHVRLILPGYEPAERAVALTAVRPEQVHAPLTSLCGRLEVITVPAGCSVRVDGIDKGTTRPTAPPSSSSRPLSLDGLPEGEHAVEVRHSNGMPATGRVRIGRGATTRQVVRLWVIDTEVRFRDGTVRYGMLANRGASGEIALAETPTRTARYARDRIAGLAEVPAATAQSLLQALRAQAGPGEPGKTVQPGPAAATTDGDLHTTAAALQASLARLSPAEIRARFLNRRLVLSGVPSKLDEDPLGKYLDFGPAIRCFLKPGSASADRREHEPAAGRSITVTGICAGSRGKTLILRGCEIR